MKKSTNVLAALIGAASAAPALEQRSFIRTFVNFYSEPGCPDDSFINALAANDEELIGPGNCPQYNTQDYFPEQQQSSGAYRVFISPQPSNFHGGTAETIIRSPVQVDDQQCGIAAHTITHEGCYAALLDSTFFIEDCLLSQNCAPSPGGTRRSTLEDTSVEKRVDGSCFHHGDEFTLLATDQAQALTNVVGCTIEAGCPVTYSVTKEVSDTISVSTSAGIEGLFSVTMGYEYTESQSTEEDVSFTLAAGQTGQIIFTPILTCYAGETVGCGEGIDDGDLQMCRHTKNAAGGTFGALSFLEED